MTLIETLAIVAITGMVMMVGFPRLQKNLLTLSRRQTATAVVEHLREAHATALLKDRLIVFSVADRGRLYGWPGATARTTGGVYLTTNRPILFYGDGTSSGGDVWVTAARRSYMVGVDQVNSAVGILRK